MNASIPFTFTHDQRRAIARFLGSDGLATHIQCVAWARVHLGGSLQVMVTAAPRPLPTVDHTTGGGGAVSGVLPPINQVRA